MSDKARELAWSIASTAFGEGAARNAFAEDIRGRIAEALREGAAPEGGDAWQPIETAPKDAGAGSILVYCAERRNTYVAIWWGDRWTHFGGGTLYETPTHWMPLPAAPKAEGGA